MPHISRPLTRGGSSSLGTEALEAHAHPKPSRGVHAWMLRASLGELKANGHWASSLRGFGARNGKRTPFRPSRGPPSTSGLEPSLQ
jgi:hypothetical protein